MCWLRLRLMAPKQAISSKTLYAYGYTLRGKYNEAFQYFYNQLCLELSKKASEIMRHSNYQFNGNLKTYRYFVS